ncbi:MAG: hydrogenase formation protein HypD [Phycisphaeraceae bacterium]|nr:MAG: hydrogenase formation protein HypD [Phycisphaeraceae bacterium]
MKYVDEFRNAELIKRTAEEIRRLADPDRRYRIMEICGGHTHAIFRFGLHQLLPKNIDLVHGPGCPVCVLPSARVDEGLEIARGNDLIFTAFGDMMRVPGSHGSPLEAKARGAEVRMVYSPLDALKLAQDNPDRRVMFFAIGFETTTPSTALTILRARERGVSNFLVHCNHIMVPPPIRAILDMPDMTLDAFIGPGHVSTVIGCEPYRFIAEAYGKPVVVSGFEPTDLMQSIAMILRQFRDGRCEVENQYARALPWDGNPAARRAMETVFEPRESFEWRGLGFIPGSGYRIREEFAAFDAEAVCEAPGVTTLPSDPRARCGDVLKGALKPSECELFGTECTPETPVGALMVSSEGACAAQFKYAHVTISA